METHTCERLHLLRSEFIARPTQVSLTGLAPWIRFYRGIADTAALDQLFIEKTVDGNRLIDTNTAEFEALREVLRERKGLRYIPKHSQTACSQCLAVVCRCGEDWWSREQS